MDFLNQRKGLDFVQQFGLRLVWVGSAHTPTPFHYIYHQYKVVMYAPARGKIHYPPVVGKHPDLLVGPPTSTVFPTNDRNFERSQFFEKNFEKI